MISGARNLYLLMISTTLNHPILTISGPINMQSHNADFWAQITSFSDDLWSKKSSEKNESLVFNPPPQKHTHTHTINKILKIL